MKTPEEIANHFLSRYVKDQFSTPRTSIFETIRDAVTADREQRPADHAEGAVKGLALDLLDEMNSTGSVHYSDYLQLHNLISDLTDPSTPESQGEPSDAQVQAAVNAHRSNRSLGDSTEHTSMRAALRAAGGVR